MRHSQKGACPIDTEYGKKAAYLIVRTVSYRLLALYKECGDFSGSPVAKTCTSSVEGMSSIPGQGTKTLHSACHAV